MFWHSVNILFWGDIFIEQKSATERISGAREEDLTDPHPVLRLNRPAQHRRFYLPMLFLCLFLLYICLTSLWNWRAFDKEWAKDNCRCAILLGLRDTENDHGVIKVSKFDNKSAWMTMIVTMIVTTTKKIEGSPLFFGRLARRIRLVARSGCLPRNTRAETMNVQPPRNIWLSSRHCTINVWLTYKLLPRDAFAETRNFQISCNRCSKILQVYRIFSSPNHHSHHHPSDSKLTINHHKISCKIIPTPVQICPLSMQISLIFYTTQMLDPLLKGLGTKATSGDSLSYHPCIILYRHKTGMISCTSFSSSTVSTIGTWG